MRASSGRFATGVQQNFRIARHPSSAALNPARAREVWLAFLIHQGHGAQLPVSPSWGFEEAAALLDAVHPEDINHLISHSAS